MTYRNLLLLLDRSDPCAARTELAIRLARSLECSLTGLAPTGIVELAPAVGAASFAEISSIAWDALRAEARNWCAAFESACRDARIGSFESRLEEDEPAAAFVRNANYHDLGIVGQVDPATDRLGASRSIIEQIVLNSARPTLLIPYAGAFPSIGSNVLVAWDESREAARAIAAAMPFLKRARAVSVCAWTEADDIDSAARRDFEPLVRWLRGHGVNPDVWSDIARIPIAEAILSRAADSGADLIVMGGYGHARWRERVFGGATRGLLSSMTVPVLMSR